MKTKSTSSAAFFNLRVLIGVALCSAGLLLTLAGLSQSMTGTVVTAPDFTRWYVDGVNGSDSNDCKSRTTACKTIGHAISLAASGDSISVAAATYTENLTIGLSLKITGADATTTIIDGGGINTVVTVNSGPVSLSGLTIQNGSAQFGGGIYNGGTLAINRSTITQNHATKTGIFHGGGGIYNQGELTINNSFISQNSATWMYIGHGGGGGIYNVGGLTMTNSTVSVNGDTLVGAGIYNQTRLTISGSTISGNSAFSSVNSDFNTQGGGIYNSGGTVTLTNSTLSGNSAIILRSKECGVGGKPYGGGIYSVGGTLTINNSTLDGNYAVGCFGLGYGGGIYSRNGGVILQNTIVSNSTTGGNCNGAVTSNGYNLSSDRTCGFNNTGDLNNTNPVLGPLQDNGGPTETMALLSGSPAIDAGNPGGCTNGQGRLLTTDQRGMPRPDHEDTGGCDMGAYESQSD